MSILFFDVYLAFANTTTTLSNPVTVLVADRKGVTLSKRVQILRLPNADFRIEFGYVNVDPSESEVWKSDGCTC